MYLRSLATAVPPSRFAQADLWPVFDALPISRTLRPGARELVRKVLVRNNGVHARHFAIPDLAALCAMDAEALNHAFEACAPELGAAALEKALELAGLIPGELDALFVCTCTGYLCPGPCSHLAERLGMRSNAHLQDVVGMGCGAAIPTLRSAVSFCHQHPAARVAVVAVEICSAAFFIDDRPDVIISACLFGDGAAAVILQGAAAGASPWAFSDFDTEHRPDQREALRFINEGGKLANRLHRSVPEKAAAAVSALWERRPGATPEDLLIPHTGGREVLQALAQALPPRAFPESSWVLEHAGNMSSPSVLFALGAYLRTHAPDVPVALPAEWGPPPARPQASERLWLASFGAGFSAYGCALRREAQESSA